MRSGELIQDIKSKILGIGKKQESLSVEVQCFNFVERVRKKLPAREVSSALSLRVKALEKMSINDRVSSLPGMYMLFEKASSKMRDLPVEQLRIIRKEHIEAFPFFKERLDFKILYFRYDQQECLLGLYFLSSVLQGALSLLDMKDVKFLREELDALYGILEREKQFEQLQLTELNSVFPKKSREYYDRLSIVVGDRVAAELYQRKYQEISEKYKLLDTFYTVINLLPEQILNENQIALLSKSQIKHLMVEQMRRLEETNDRLSREIDKRNRAQLGFKESESKLLTIIEQSMDPIIQLDAMGHIIYWNGQAENQFKWTKEEVTGKTVDSMIVPERFRKRFMDGFYRFIAGSNSSQDYYRIEMWASDKEGNEMVVELSASKIYTAQGPVLNAILRDVSERVLREKYLRDAKEAAEKASSAKAKFLSTMSHEIRTPLNAIVGATNLMLDSPLNEEQQENLEVLKFSADNLLVIVNDILDYNKIEEGKLKFESNVFNLRSLVSSAINSLQGIAKNKGISLVCEVHEHTPDLVIGDETRLSQILINLANNGIKFTSRGHVKIIVRPESRDEDRCLIKFVVEDTGIGIPLDKKDYIFEMFTQVQNSTTREHGGTGLGLAICRKLIEQQGGEISVQSTEGLGSTFIFSLPFVLDKTPHNNQKIIKMETEKDLNGMKILLVEDYPINQMIAMKFLKKWNCEVDVAENGQIAVEMVQKSNYELILMDIQMPVMDGFQSTLEIRKLGGEYAHIPIFALTASVMIDSKQRVFEVGMNDFITKPFKTEELYQKLNQVKNNV